MRKSSRAWRIYIGTLFVLLAAAISLFVYAAATNGLHQPHLPGSRFISQEVRAC